MASVKRPRRNSAPSGSAPGSITLPPASSHARAGVPRQRQPEANANESALPAGASGVTTRPSAPAATQPPPGALMTVRAAPAIGEVGDVLNSRSLSARSATSFASHDDAAPGATAGPPRPHPASRRRAAAAAPHRIAALTPRHQSGRLVMTPSSHARPGVESLASGLDTVSPAGPSSHRERLRADLAHSSRRSDGAQAPGTTGTRREARPRDRPGWALGPAAFPGIRFSPVLD